MHKKHKPAAGKPARQEESKEIGIGWMMSDVINNIEHRPEEEKDTHMLVLIEEEK